MRLLLPWIAGVFCGDLFFFARHEVPFMPFLLFISLFLLFISYFIRRYSIRWVFGISLFFATFIGGWCFTNQTLNLSKSDFSQTRTVYRAIIFDEPVAKERSVLCPVHLLAQSDSCGNKTLAKKVLLYVAKDSLALHLKMGDELLFYALLAPLVNRRNFDEFDYERYLARKGIAGVGYADSQHWMRTTAVYPISWQQKAKSYQKKVLDLYDKLGLKDREKAVLSALTIGYKGELSEDIRESYSVSGASHVLALSGLHIGLLSCILLWMGKWIPQKWKGVHFLRYLLVVLILWSFAFFTGMSASVVRSVLMFSILMFSIQVGRQPLTLNTLAATGFLMLLVHPLWLFDVGFQLSFSAVAGIVLIHPYLYGRVTVRNRFMRWGWGLISVSIAAQMATAPLVLFYFSRFSTYFLLTNLVVIPLVSLIMYVAVLMLLLFPVPLLQSVVAVVLAFLLKILNGFVCWVQQLPGSSLDGIWVYKTEVFIFYLWITFTLLYFISHHHNKLFASLICLLLFCVFHSYHQYSDRLPSCLVFYNTDKCPVVHCISSDKRSWMVFSEDKDYNRHRKQLNYLTAFINHHHLSTPLIIESSYSSDSLQYCNEILCYKNTRIAFVNDQRWINKEAKCRLKLDYLYLCKGYYGHLAALTRIFDIDHVLIDSSLSEERKDKYFNECRRLHLDAVSLRDHGAIIRYLQSDTSE